LQLETFMHFTAKSNKKLLGPAGFL
jgi:hypothetical protein